MKTHKCESTDKAKSIKIGKVENEDVYYLDIISQDGNQQTVGTGTLDEVIEYIQFIKFY